MCTHRLVVCIHRVIPLHLFPSDDFSVLSQDLPSGTVIKNPPINAEDPEDRGSIPGSGRAPEGGIGNPLQYACLGTPLDRGAWQVTVLGVPQS